MNSTSPDNLETLVFPAAADFDAWLVDNYARQEGIWIKMAKVNSSVPSITSDQAVDVGLCWGWISSHRKGLDDTYFLQKYTPRRPKSNWSRVNVNKVEMLTDTGRMRAPGQMEITAAKADGRWDAAT
jgi:uncharacterized protein YdeI (YjbR/CyaY-like superfamily)